MKLLSHNHLLCLNKFCKSNDALIIDPKKVTQIESEPKLSFMIHILSMIDYNVLLIAAQQIGIKDIPSTLPSKEVMESSESFLRSMQKVLLDSNIVEGRLICSKCKTSYSIANGVVDMMHPQISQEHEHDNEEKQNESNEYEEDIDMNNLLNEADQNQNQDEDLQQNQNDINNNNDNQIDDATNQGIIDVD
eukprot:UN04778